mmetsp:Transcript_53401/g.72972  ORF Transcript_53401/g.72972 Transcript_53401/m.72972 type:complete len:83 (+) Transcript_53401:2-250(+)
MIASNQLRKAVNKLEWGGRCDGQPDVYRIKLVKRDLKRRMSKISSMQEITLSKCRPVSVNTPLSFTASTLYMGKRRKRDLRP